MNAQEAIQRLAKQNPMDIDTEAVSALAEAVEAASEYGYGPYPGALEEWLGAGDFDGNETVEIIAAEWDADRE